MKPGVAAGWSSCAILEALEVNGSDGRLFSSDFPYIRQRDSAAEIGTLVPAKFRERWRLAVDGDRVNLPRFLDEIKTIDLFHYDSDKSICEVGALRIASSNPCSLRRPLSSLMTFKIIAISEISSRGWSCVSR